jgi:hypothetical protein
VFDLSAYTFILFVICAVKEESRLSWIRPSKTCGSADSRLGFEHGWNIRDRDRIFRALGGQYRREIGLTKTSGARAKQFGAKSELRLELKTRLN